MCGILGYSGNVAEGTWHETYDLLTALFLESEKRGRDATGFVARTEPFKNPMASDVVLSKQPVPARRFVADDSSWRALRHRRCSMVLGHVRFATHGSPEQSFNNHPLVGRRGLYLVHNGVLSGHEANAERLGLELTTGCDSETILRLAEAQHPSLGLNDALRELSGSMTAVVYNSSSDWLYFARNAGRPLWLLKLKNRKAWWFASTREILVAAFESVLGDIADRVELLMPLACDHVHALSPLGSLVALPEVETRRSWV